MAPHFGSVPLLHIELRFLLLQPSQHQLVLLDDVLVVPQPPVVVQALFGASDPTSKEVASRRHRPHARQVPLLCNQVRRLLTALTKGLLILNYVGHLLHQDAVAPLDLLEPLLLQEYPLWLDNHMLKFLGSHHINASSDVSDAIPMFKLHLLVPVAFEFLVHVDLTFHYYN